MACEGGRGHYAAGEVRFFFLFHEGITYPFINPSPLKPSFPPPTPQPAAAVKDENDREPTQS